MEEVIPDTPVAEPDTAPLMAITQAQLQRACKRRRLSSNGRKSILLERLSSAAIKTKEEILSLANLFDSEGPLPSTGDSTSGEARARQPPWTSSELARLCHVIADPRHYTAFERLHRKPESRAELDKARHDPWSAEFQDAFNDDGFQPHQPAAVDGVTVDILNTFDPLLHPHKRTGEALRSKWSYLRSRFTICERNYTRSGQGETDIFPDFTEGQSIMSYMHCVFKTSPTLDMVLREIGDGNRAECGLEGNDVAEKTASVQNTGGMRARSSRGKPAHSLTDEGLKSIAESLKAPVQVSLSVREDEGGQANVVHDKQVAETLAALLSVERTLRSELKQADDEHDEPRRVIALRRIEKIQEKIEKHLVS